MEDHLLESNLLRSLQDGAKVLLDNSTIDLDENVSDSSFDSGAAAAAAAGNRDHGRDAYEFVAFLLWYLFLVLCCVVPTCCAYRRRRLVEARIAQQQASVTRIERQNLFILSSLRHGQQNTERIREQRGNKISEELEATTMTVEEENLMEISDESQSNMKKCITCKVKIIDDQQQNAMSEDGGEPTNLVAMEYDVEAADPENTHVLKLTTTNTAVVDETDEESSTATTTTSRIVPGACAICLCPYEIGDKVTWSPRDECQHAFHSDCIIPWLAKSEEPKCPCCRQDYCDPIPISQLDLGPTSLFGGTDFAGGDNDDSIVPQFMRTLEASRLDFLTNLELAAVQASTRARDGNTTVVGQAGGVLDGSPFELTLAESGDTINANSQADNNEVQARGSPFIDVSTEDEPPSDDSERSSMEGGTIQEASPARTISS